MVTTQSDLLAQLHTAISGWTTEVGAAQEHLSQQIDGANTQLGRLLAVLQERNGQAVSLAEAQAEVERLQKAIEQGDLPPGTVTHYTPNTDEATAARTELQTTMDRLQGAIRSWTQEVSQSQRGLLDEFTHANGQLERLLDVLGHGGGEGGPGGGSQAEYDQIRHERDVLSDEVHALNIEVEALQKEQASFASANLEAETARETRQREELEGLRAALAERDSFIDECQGLLEDSQRIEASLTEEIADLERQVAVYARSEDQLKDALERQRRESEQHIQALAGLTGELEALRRALAAEENQVPPAESEVIIPDGASEELASAHARIEALEATVASLEAAAAEPAEASPEIDARVAELEGELASRPDAAAHAALQEEVAALSSRPERAELEAAEARITALEAELAARPDPSDLAALEQQIAELEVIREQQRLQRTESLGEAKALAEDIREAGETYGEEAGAPVPGGGVSPADQMALEGAIVQLETELNGLRQREEESVSTARTLLQELETHRDFEAAQEEALSNARAEADALQQRLDEQAQAARAEEERLAAQLAEARDETERLRALLEDVEAKHEAAKTALDAAQAERAASADKATTADEARAEAQAALDARQVRIDELEGMVAELASAQEAAEARAGELERALDAARAATGEPDDKPAGGNDATDQIVALEAALAEQNAAGDRLEVVEKELEAARKRIGELEQGGAAGTPGDEQALLERQAAEIQELRESQQTAEKWIDDLEKQIATSETALAEMRAAREAMETQYGSFSGELAAVRDQEATRSTELAEARAERDRAQARITECETAIAELERQLAESNEALAAAHVGPGAGEIAPSADHDGADLHAEVAALRSGQADLESELAAARNRAQELLLERDEIAAALHETTVKQAAQEEDLAEAVSKLETQQQALREREEEIEAFRRDIADMSAQLQTLTEEEQNAKSHAETLKESLDAIQASDSLHVDELAKTRELLESMRAEHDRQLEAASQLASRGDELEHLLQAAQSEGLTAEATVEELQAALQALEAKEATESAALEETRKLVADHQGTLQEREARVAELEAQLAAVQAEKDAMSEASAQQEAAMQATMAEVSETIAERDELRDSLAKVEQQRQYAGEAGAGLGSEAVYSQEQRARQQDIVLSELTHPEENRTIGDILVDAEVITREQLAAALAVQESDPSQLLGTILIEQDITTDDAIAQAVACQLGKPLVNPTEVHVQPQAIGVLNRDLCTWHVCLPLRMTEDRMVVAMANPLDESARIKLRDVSQREITPVVGAASQIMNAIESHYGAY